MKIPVVTVGHVLAPPARRWRGLRRVIEFDIKTHNGYPGPTGVVHLTADRHVAYVAEDLRAGERVVVTSSISKAPPAIEDFLNLRAEVIEFVTPAQPVPSPPPTPPGFVPTQRRRPWRR